MRNPNYFLKTTRKGFATADENGCTNWDQEIRQTTQNPRLKPSFGKG